MGVKQEMTVKIVCINKSDGYHENPHEAISHYGWKNESSDETGISDRQSMVNWMKQGNYAYVVDQYGQKVYCQVRVSVNGTEFLQTESDNKLTNNLLSLIECI